MKDITRKLISIGAALLMAVSSIKAQETHVSDESYATYDVGEIPVEYTLTPTGAVTYQVPMDIHPDPEDFHPRLSFGYNSQQRESALGYGWNIGGLSAITHVAGTVYYDGTSSPLSLDEDKLMMDGMRLLKTDTDEWQSEQGFVKVRKQTGGTFEARYPDGNTATFEASAQAPFSYVMTSYKNRSGRTIKYVYTQADNLPYIRTVLYGEEDGAYNDSIAFTYRHTDNAVTRYMDGRAFRHSRLLEKVELFYKGRLWRRYLLTYQDEGVSLPVRLDCETEGARLTPLRFGYGNASADNTRFNESTCFLERYFPNSNAETTTNGYRSLALSRGKFSHTSQSDGLISYPVFETYSEGQHLLVYKDLSDMTVSPVVFTAGKGFKQLEAVDTNGDGLEEPVKINYADDQLTVSVYTNDIDPNRHSDYVYPEGSGYVHDRQMLTGDFDGDGKVELLAVSSCYDSNKKKKYASRALLVDLHYRTTVYDGTCFDFTLYQTDSRALCADRLMALDYNGDGKTDICLINVNGLYVYEFTGEGFRQLAYSNAINIMHFNFEGTFRDRELMAADMNGDGNMDIILGPRRVHCRDGFKHLGDGICYGACHDESNLTSTSASGYKQYVHPSGQKCLVDPSVSLHDLLVFDSNVGNGKQWTFLLSTGNSSYSASSQGFKTYTEELFYCYHETVGANFMLVDVNNDGLPDLLRNVRGEIYLHLNENGKISKEHSERPVMHTNNLLAQFAMANVSQSYYWSGGLICVDNEQVHVYGYTYDTSKERLLCNLTDSYGVTYNHYYTDIMKTSANRYVGQPDHSLGYISYPYAVMTPHLYVPSWLEKRKDGEQLSWESYKYTNAVFHRTGLGFRGFRKIETNDMLNNRTMTSVFDPELLSAEIRKETPTDTIARKYVLERKDDKTVLLKLEREVVHDALNGTEKATAYEYDNYGLVTKAFTSYGGNCTETRRWAYQTVEDDHLYLLGLVYFAQTQRTRKDSTFVQEVRTEYDREYLPFRKESFVNGNTVANEFYFYNDYQQLIHQDRHTYAAFNWLAENYSYNSDRRLLQKTDPMGLHTTYAYDTLTGLLQSSADHQGRAIRHEYDAWGRLVKTCYPDGRVKQVSMAWSGDGEPGLYVVTTAETGKPVTKTYYDCLNREVRTSQIRFDGREMKTDKVYNAKTGLLEKESLPTTDSVPSRWNSFAYDTFGRPTATRHASGKTDSCAYGALTDTIVENGIRRIRQYDATGLMTRVTDEAGSIDYYYRPDGQPVVSVVGDNVQTRFYYDKYGRRIAIKDPSAGIRRTEYDDAGNVSKETDADGREVVKEYDRYGRVVKQTTPDLTTVYTYDDTENLLLSVVSNNGCALYNTYDEYGRLHTQREEAPDGKWLQKTYSYTDDGLPATVAYASQNGALATERLTYRNGFLTEVRLNDADSTLVYRHDEENSLGQLTKLTAGGMQRTYEFNEWGLPVRRSITRADGSVMFDHSYRFDATNNTLTKRTDELRNLSEDFGYDGLNRLCSYGNKTVLYDNYGNIRRKGDAGELVYTNPNRPYAVTGLSPVEENPVKSGLDITYTAGERPSVITQDGKKAVLTYNSNHDRVRMEYSVNDSILLSRYYLGGNYELDIDSIGTQERLYLGGDYYSAPAVLIKQNGCVSIYFIHRDYLGSILQVADMQGNVVEETSFDAWGCRRNPLTHEAYTKNENVPNLMLGRGFTGHEHLTMFGLINMNARLYDPVLGRFLSPDPYVQLLDNTQAFNRYSYCMNSPLCYVDENGEFFLSILVGAAIGAAISAISYSVTTVVTGQPWNSSSFWKSIGIGAVGGAIGGACGYIGSNWLGEIGNTFGYNMVSNVTNMAATNAIFGYDTSWGDVLSMVAGASVGSALPTFKGVNGGKFVNGVSEIGYNTMRGVVTGLASGVVNAAIQKEPERIWQGAVGGAISGASRSVAMNVIFGAPYKVDKSYGVEGLYRGGGVSDLLKAGLGLTMGRNMYVSHEMGDEGTRYHENYHIQQQNEMGWAKFYGTTIYEYIKYGFGGMIDVYSTKGTLEYNANRYENKMTTPPWGSKY